MDKYIYIRKLYEAKIYKMLACEYQELCSGQVLFMNKEKERYELIDKNFLVEESTYNEYIDALEKKIYGKTKEYILDYHGITKEDLIRVLNNHND